MKTAWNIVKRITAKVPPNDETALTNNNKIGMRFPTDVTAFNNYFLKLAKISQMMEIMLTHYTT
jgi:hypothetical protein